MIWFFKQIFILIQLMEAYFLIRNQIFIPIPFN